MRLVRRAGLRLRAIIEDALHLEGLVPECTATNARPAARMKRLHVELRKPSAD
jgi:hypothetical protein